MIVTALAVLMTMTTPAKMQWWADARFGMFVHWDMSSVAGTEISWSRKGSKPLDITGDPAGYVEDPAYDNLYKRFNPTGFNAEEWVSLAKAGGMKYVVFTAKHHGGFSMFHTKYSKYGIEHTAFKRDVLKELLSACRRNGLKVGIYYSPRDWHQPDYGSTDPSKYHAFLMGQLTELLTHYGKIDIMWFDSFGKGDSLGYWKADEMLALVHRLQPGILVNNRAGSFTQKVPSLAGDFDTPEQTIGAFQNTRPWESCMTIQSVPDGGGWSYRKDGVCKSGQECYKALVSCAAGDGNLLLDVGPDATGRIPDDQAKVLREVGDCLNIRPGSIYGTHGGPYRSTAAIASTYRGNDIYIHAFDASAAQAPHADYFGITLPPLKAKILSIENLLDSKNPVGFRQSSKEIFIDGMDSSRPIFIPVYRLHLDRPAADEMVGGHPIEIPAH